MDSELKQFIQHISSYIFPEQFRADVAHEEIAVRGSLGILLASFTDDAPSIMESFVAQLPVLKSLIESDVQAIRLNDPAVESEREIILCYPGLKEMLYYRSAHILHTLGVPVLPRFITEAAHSLFGIDIHPAAEIGHHFCIDHGTGIVIGATAIIGNNVTIYQGVTLGAKNFHHDDNGLPIDEPRHPILDDNVTVYSNASILGRVRIGEGTVVGGNVWLTHDVAPHSVVLQTSQIKSI